MKAIILAAGKGSRLYPVTLDLPKGLLVIGGETILDRLIRQFKEFGIDDILLVVGYKKEKFKKHFGESVRYIEYKDYDKTNNLHTLWSVRDYISKDTIITFADLVLHDSVINKLMKSRNDITVTVDTSQVLDGTMKVEVDNDRLLSIKTTTVEDASGNFIGLAKFSNSGCKMLVNEMSKLISGNFDDYYTLALDKMSRRGEVINYCDISGIYWREIDTKDEYDEVRSMNHISQLR
jgi:L-glutamine-phosphate cytidylyltransferase